MRAAERPTVKDARERERVLLAVGLQHQHLHNRDAGRQAHAKACALARLGGDRERAAHLLDAGEHGREAHTAPRAQVGPVARGHPLHEEQ